MAPTLDVAADQAAAQRRRPVDALIGGLVDISARKAIEAELVHEATHDPLTGLANRTMLIEQVGRALAAAQRNQRTCALLMLDLDHFK